MNLKEAHYRRLFLHREAQLPSFVSIHPSLFCGRKAEDVMHMRSCFGQIFLSGLLRFIMLALGLQVCK